MLGVGRYTGGRLQAGNTTYASHNNMHTVSGNFNVTKVHREGDYAFVLLKLEARCPCEGQLGDVVPSTSLDGKTRAGALTRRATNGSSATPRTSLLRALTAPLSVPLDIGPKGRPNQSEVRGLDDELDGSEPRWWGDHCLGHDLQARRFSDSLGARLDLTVDPVPRHINRLVV